MTMKKPYELTFWGGLNRRYVRWHTTLDAAQAEALKMLSKMDNRAAKPAIIYGPNLGDGKTIA